MIQYIVIGYRDAELKEILNKHNIEDDAKINYFKSDTDISEGLEQIGISRTLQVEVRYIGDGSIVEESIAQELKDIHRVAYNITVPLQKGYESLSVEFLEGHNDGNKVVYQINYIEDQNLKHIILTKQAKITSDITELENEIYTPITSWNIYKQPALNSSIKDVAPRLIDMIKKENEHPTAIEIGCGGGGLTIALASYDIPIYGCEVSPVINFARLKRDTAIQVNSVDKYIAQLQEKIPETFNPNNPFQTNTLTDEAQAIKFPLKEKTKPLFFQSPLDLIKRYVGEDLPKPDSIILNNILGTPSEKIARKTFEDISYLAKPESTIYIIEGKKDMIRCDLDLNII